MKKIVFLISISFFCGYVYPDVVSIPYTLNSNDTLTNSKYNANNNAFKNAFNGNISNVNIKSGANISQSKIDSSGSGWISNTVGYFENRNNFIELHSPYGLKRFMNDSVTFDREEVLITDSTDTIYTMSNDSISLRKKVSAKNVTIVADSVHSIKGVKATIGNFSGYVNVGSYVNVDSLHSTKGITATTGRFTDSVKAGDLNIGTSASNKRFNLYGFINIWPDSATISSYTCYATSSNLKIGVGSSGTPDTLLGLITEDGAHRSGDIVIIRKYGTDALVIPASGGNIRLSTSDFIADDIQDNITLMSNGTDFFEITRTNY